MKLKQKAALLLACIMMVGIVGIMSPTEAKAAGEKNTFTLIVPGDINFTADGWNDIGIIGVSNVSIEEGKKISLSIEDGATGRTLKKLGDATKTVSYEVRKGTAASSEAFGGSLEFTDNGTQEIGAVVIDLAGAGAGNYEDTINFTAALQSDGVKISDVFNESTEWEMVLQDKIEYVITYKMVGGNFVFQKLLCDGTDCTERFKDSCPVTNSNPSFTFDFAGTGTVTLNTATNEYTRTGETPKMISFKVNGIELIDTMTDKT